MYRIFTTKKFDKSVKLCIKRGLDIRKLDAVIGLLKENGSLPAEYKPHKLKGDYEGCWECHIQPDWLLIWAQNEDEFILILTDTGTHSDLF